MKLKWLFTVLFIFGLSIIVAAQADFPDKLLEDGEITISDPELIIDEDFSDEDAWENYEDNLGAVYVDTDDEVYIVGVEYDDGPRILWGQDYRILGNVVIQVETEQLSRDDNNGYGVMCRVDPSNSTGYGYLFYISGDGFVTIRKRTEDIEEPENITDWTESSAINQGEDENELVAVCVDDYLGFYVNGELVAEAYDDTFSEGVIAFAASIFEEDEDVEIAFDNLLVWEVEGDGGSGSSRSSTSGREDVDLDELEDDITHMLADGDVEIELEDVLLVETWDEAGEWDEFEEDGYAVEVSDGAYILEEHEGLLVWGTNLTEHDDVVMRVEIERITDGEDNGFGLMCRVDPEDLEDGYSFIIRPNGTYAIGYWEEFEYTTLLDEDFVSNSDIDDADSYVMTVVCVGEYLALYLDGELIGEVEDDTFDEGYAAAAAIAFDDDGVEASFDNLVIWEATD